MKERFNETLEVIARFIGTHGLAVFLVIFYALVIYPQSQLERSEWIKEITKVRILVDPDSKPLNLNQADAVASMVISQFTQALQQSYSSRDGIERYRSPIFRELLTIDDEANEGVKIKKYYVFNKKFEFSEADSKDELFNKYQKAYDHIDFNAKDISKNMQKSAKKYFYESKRSNEIFNVQLERLKLERGDMASVWRNALEIAEKDWGMYFKGKIPRTDYSDVQNLVRGLKVMPYYREWVSTEVSNHKVVDDFEEVDIFVAINLVKNKLEAEMSSGLKNASTQE